MKCVRTLQDIGIKVTNEEADDIIKMAVTEADLEDMKEFIKEENTETLQDYLFKVFLHSVKIESIFTF